VDNLEITLCIFIWLKWVFFFVNSIYPKILLTMIIRVYQIKYEMFLIIVFFL